MSFLEAMKNQQNFTTTENGAITHKTTCSDLLDFFSRAGAYRTRTESDVIRAFDKAFCEDQLLAMKALFYFRDIRGGQGERRLFRVIIKFLAENHTDIVRKNLSLITEYGRWDDLYEVFGTELESDALELIKKQWEVDINSEKPSLLGKWLKSENTSSERSRELGRKTRKALGLTSKQYRKSLSKLRKAINIVETNLSQKTYDLIDYTKLPSKAGLQYRQAFMRNDESSYQTFLKSLEKGDVKVNSSTLYPYELVEKVLYGRTSVSDNKLFDGMWNNLPDYIGEEAEDSIVVADVSGSMNGRPMAVSISLAMYMAERNTGAFKDHFITFSATPRLEKVTGSSFAQKVRNLSRAHWDMSTNVKKVFELILDTALKNNMTQDDIPKKLYIVSDMEFDSADRNVSKTLFQKIREQYAEHDFKIPELVFWNVNARSDQSPMTIHDTGVQLVSGCSPSIFESLMKNSMISAYDLMLEVLNQERYDLVTI